MLSGPQSPSPCAASPAPLSSPTRPREELVSEINARLRRNAAAAAKKRKQNDERAHPHGNAAAATHRHSRAGGRGEEGRTAGEATTRPAKAAGASPSPAVAAERTRAEAAVCASSPPAPLPPPSPSSLPVAPLLPLLPLLPAPLSSATRQALLIANLSSHPPASPPPHNRPHSPHRHPQTPLPPSAAPPTLLHLSALSIPSSASRRMTFKATRGRADRSRAATVDGGGEGDEEDEEDEVEGNEGEDSEVEVEVELEDAVDCGSSASSSSSTSLPPLVVMLGSAAFESAADAIERQQRQQSHAAMPFIHRLTTHKPPSHSSSTAAPAASTLLPAAEEQPLLHPGVAVSGADAALVTGLTSAPLAEGAPPSSGSAESTPLLTAAAPTSPSSCSLPSPSDVGDGFGSVSTKAHHTLLLLCCEVLSSEATYVSRLDDLLLHYVTPLKLRHSALGLARDDVYALFSYIEPIVDLHHQLLEQLLQAQPPPLPPSEPPSIDLPSLDRCVAHVASTFLSYHPYLKMYNAYVNQYNGSMERLKRLSEGRKFVRFLAQAHTSHILDLPSYLIMPIQRIPRYELFLTSMLRLLGGGCAEGGASGAGYRFTCTARLSSALCQIQSIAGLINESKRAAEAAEKMLELKKRIRGLPPSTALLAPHRRLLREDSVMQLRPKRRDYILVTFNDALLLLSQAWRVKGFYLLDELAQIRHYEPKAAHAAHRSAQQQSLVEGEEVEEEEREQRVLEPAAEEDDEDECDDSEYASSVELELRKGREREAAVAGTGAAAAAAGGGAGEGRAGLKLKRFSLAFTAAIAALTDQRTIVLQFQHDAHKASWVQDLHKASAGANIPATGSSTPAPAASPFAHCSSPSACPSPPSSSSLFAPSLLSTTLKLGGAAGGALPSSSSSSCSSSASTEAAPSSNATSPLPSPLSSPSSAPPPSPSSASLAPSLSLPPSLPSPLLLAPSFSSPAATSSSSAHFAQLPPLGAVPVLPARPRANPASSASHPLQAQSAGPSASPARSSRPDPSTSASSASSSFPSSLSYASSAPFSYSLPQLTAASNPLLRSLLAPAPSTPPLLPTQAKHAGVSSSSDSAAGPLHSSPMTPSPALLKATEVEGRPSLQQPRAPARPPLLSEWKKLRQQQPDVSHAAAPTVALAIESDKENEQLRLGH